MGEPPGPPVGRARSLRVAMVCPYSLDRPGGVQNQATGLSRELVRRGHDVVMFAPVDGPRGGTSVRCDGVEVVSTGAPVHLPANGSVAPVSVSPLGVRRAERVLRRGGFDVVHVHEPFAPGLSYALLAGSSYPPLVATFHRSGVSAWYRAVRPVGSVVARRLAVRSAVSDAAAVTARRVAGGDYETLFNGIDTEAFSGVAGTPTSGPTILFLGRHERRKGLDVLLDAHTRLGSAHQGEGSATPPPVVLWVGGDGPETTRLRERYPPGPTRHWLGVLTEAEKRSRLAGADVLCAPSLGGESFGIVLLEGMAAGTRVVASDIGGYRDASAGHAVLVPPGDPEALARALASALAPAGNGRWGDVAEAPSAAVSLRDARAHADRWSMRELAARYERLYLRVVAAPTA